MANGWLSRFLWKLTHVDSATPNKITIFNVFFVVEAVEIDEKAIV